MVRLAFIIAMLFTAPWEEAETIEIRDRGTVDLKSFGCQDITRSSLINRVCYDAADHSMLVRRYVTWQQYCDVPRDTLDAFLNAPSMGRFFKTDIEARPDIEGGRGNGRYVCPSRTS